MYRIKSNLDFTGKGWGLAFEHGEAFTERDDLAQRLRSLGYEVTPVAPVEQSTPPAAPEPAPAPESEPEATVTTPVEQSSESGPGKDEPAQEPEPEGGKIACPICGKLCGSQAVLTRHTNKEHG